MTSENTAIPDFASLLGRHGQISQLVPGFVEREQQIAMANDVFLAIQSRTHLLVEAGTGTGKTFAYLMALLHAGGKAIVSTGTKTLQDQLYYKDLPIVRQLGRHAVRVALLKGRSNYLCPQRLDRNLKVIDAGTKRETIDALMRVRAWSSTTRTGDLTEWLDVESEGHLLPWITSSVDNCLGNECPRFEECPLYAARARAAEADIVVVNHHLLFADFALQDDNIASLLPAADAIVIDEAHQIADVARQFFGSRVSSGQFVELSRDIQAEVTILGGDEMLLAQKARLLEQRTAELAAAFQERRGRELDVILGDEKVRRVVAEVDLVLGSLRTALDTCASRSKVLASCATRVNRIADRFALLTEPAEASDYAHWLEQGDRGFVIHLTPISIAETFKARLDVSRSAWILTSATLTVGEEFDYIRELLGLPEVLAHQYESPFDYPRQVRGWVPPIVARPGTDEHTLALMTEVLPLLRTVQGRTFLLFTSYRAMNLAADILGGERGLRFLVQGQQPKAMLLERFREIDQCVLVATHSFWEGVDVRGARLRCLVIDKLPFSSPDDPVTRAKVRALDESGGRGFRDYMIPHAAITLRQGFGRLIRDETDKGLFVLGDPRVRTQSYGKLFLNSLPQMDWCLHQAEAMEYLEQIERESVR